MVREGKTIPFLLLTTYFSKYKIKFPKENITRLLLIDHSQRNEKKNELTRETFSDAYPCSLRTKLDILFKIYLHHV